MKNKSPIYYINKNCLIKDNDANKSFPKYYSNYDGSIYNINSLIDKMNSLKKLMYNSIDFKSMLVMDQYGLKYSNDLRRNINSAKKLMSPNKYKIFENKNNDYNIKYIQRKNEHNNLVNNKKIVLNSNNDFDLTNMINLNKTKKEEIKQILDDEKKEQKLSYLKTELFLLDQQLKDSLLSNNKIKKNLTFIREDIIKDNQYSQIKSKYMDKIKNKKTKNLILNKFNTKSLRLKHFSKNAINRNKIIKKKINGNENRDNHSKLEENLKLNKKTMYFKDKINSYKAKKIIYNKTFTDELYNINRNPAKEKYNLKAHLTTAPNLTVFNNYTKQLKMNNLN